MLVGPGQDAGAVDVGDGIAVVFKLESHSHPSAVEPYQGAATGVGGIVRDVISMGARPIALLDPLRFGPLDQERNRWLFEGVVAGIGGYGNCIGVPTVGGEVQFAPAHTANPTVNVMCVGVAPAERLVTSDREVHDGSLLVLFGAATGRDGIGGVSVLASAASRTGPRNVDRASDRRSVRGEAPDRGLARARRTRPARRAAGPGRGGDHVRRERVRVPGRARRRARPGRGPLREPGLEAFEILTSESQERMLAIVHPDRLGDVGRVAVGLSTAVIGRLVRGGVLRATFRGAVIADVPARSLADEGPVYTRPIGGPAEVEDAIADDPTFATVTTPPDEAFLAVLGSPNVASKRWVWEQYDSIVQGGTVMPPGADAALVRIEGTLKALALSTDGKGRFGALDPYLGAAHAVAEAARNVACTGATPLAITNCLNFGNPERPEVMWQFAQSVRGIADACRAFETPVTGGNVSFYNESGSSAIWPTPVIGMLGLIEDHRLAVRGAFTGNGSWIYLLGETFAELGERVRRGGARVGAGAPPRARSRTRARAPPAADRRRPHRLAGERARLLGGWDRDRARRIRDRRWRRLRRDAAGGPAGARRPVLRVGVARGGRWLPNGRPSSRTRRRRPASRSPGSARPAGPGSCSTGCSRPPWPRSRPRTRNDPQAPRGVMVPGGSQVRC